MPYHVAPENSYSDPDFGDTDIQVRAKKQATLLQHFWTRWRLEYLTGLREFHQASGNNIQTIKPGAVVLVHDDTPRINWHLAVVEDTISGEDGLIRAANIRTSTGKTNHPVRWHRKWIISLLTKEDLFVKLQSGEGNRPKNVQSPYWPPRKISGASNYNIFCIM